MESIVNIIVDNSLVAASSVTFLLVVLGLIWLRSSSAKSIDPSDDDVLNDEMQKKHKKGSKTRLKKVKLDKAKPSVPNGHVAEQHFVNKTTTADVPKTSDGNQGGTVKAEAAKPSKLTKEIKKQTKEAEKLDSSGEWTTVATTRKKPKAKEGNHQKDAACAEELQTKDECSKPAEPNESIVGTRCQPLTTEKDEVKTILPVLSEKYSEADNAKVPLEVELGSTSVDPCVTSFMEANLVDEERPEAAAADSNDEEAKTVEGQTKKKKKKKSKSSAATVEIGMITGKDVNATVNSKPVAELKRDEVLANVTPTVEPFSSVEQQNVKADAMSANAVSEASLVHQAAYGEECSSNVVPTKTIVVFDELGDDAAATLASVSNKKKKKPRREN